MELGLNPKQERFVLEEIQSGRFQTADELLDSALAALHPTNEIRPLSVWN